MAPGSASAGSLGGGNFPSISQDLGTFTRGENSLLDKIFDAYAAKGRKVPAQGETYSLTDYFEPTNGVYGAQLVIYQAIGGTYGMAWLLLPYPTTKGEYEIQDAETGVPNTISPNAIVACIRLKMTPAEQQHANEQAEMAQKEAEIRRQVEREMYDVMQRAEIGGVTSSGLPLLAVPRTEIERQAKEELERRLRQLKANGESPDNPNWYNNSLEKEFRAKQQEARQKAAENVQLTGTFIRGKNLLWDSLVSLFQGSNPNAGLRIIDFGETYNSANLYTQITKADDPGKDDIVVYLQSNNEPTFGLLQTQAPDSGEITVQNRLQRSGFQDTINISDVVGYLRMKHFPQHTLLPSDQTPPAQQNPNVSNTKVPQALPGERYPQTRQLEITTDEMARMNIAQVRYAINEVYARYGATFPRTPDVQQQFQKFSWYHPNPGITFETIDQKMSDIERQNVKVLAAYRETLRQQGSR
jgi:YARHG domain